jgi:hypothetical protein
MQHPLATARGLYLKSFKVVIYDCNDSIIIIYNRTDSGDYYETILAGIINYNRKLCYKLWLILYKFYDRKFTIVNYTFVWSITYNRN